MLLSTNILNQFSSVAMASSFYSPALRLDLVELGSISVDWTGTPVGTFTLEVSNEAVAESPSSGSFGTIGGSSLAVSAAGQQTWMFTSKYYARWIRLAWTSTSGSGTLTSAVITTEDEV